MGAMASQITSLIIVYSTVYSGADQRKHQSSASLAFVWGIYRWPVNSPHKWPVTRKMFPLMTSSWALKPWSSIMNRFNHGYHWVFRGIHINTFWLLLFIKQHIKNVFWMCFIFISQKVKVKILNMVWIRSKRMHRFVFHALFILGVH